ncbi:tetratricopeptide repeat protein [Candidatus Margulisiibacteriota bacterium]
MVKKIIVFLLVTLCLSAFAHAQIKTDFDYGMEAFEEGNYERATKDFKTAFKKNPEEIGFRFYYALALYYSGRMKEAEQEFKKVVDHNPASPWAKSAKAYLKNIYLGIEAPEPENDFGGYLSFSYDNDDNIAYSAFAMADGYDNRLSTNFLIAYKPSIYSYKPISFSFSTLKTSYEKNTAYNDHGWGSGISLNIPLPASTFATLTYDNKRYFQDPDAAYFNTDDLETGLMFKVFPGDPQWTTIYIGNTNTLYQNPTYEAYNSFDTKFGIRQQLSTVVYVQYEGKASHAKDPDYENVSDEYTIGAFIPLPYFHKLYISQTYINKHFAYNDSVGGRRRQDSMYIYDFYGYREYFDDFTLGLRYTITNNTSNLDKSQTALSYGSYVGNVLSLLISYNF